MDGFWTFDQHSSWCSFHHMLSVDKKAKEIDLLWQNVIVLKCFTLLKTTFHAFSCSEKRDEMTKRTKPQIEANERIISTNVDSSDSSTFSFEAKCTHSMINNLIPWLNLKLYNITPIYGTIYLNKCLIQSYLLHICIKRHALCYRQRVANDCQYSCLIIERLRGNM